MKTEYIIEMREGKIYPTDESRELIERFIDKRHATPFLIDWNTLMPLVEKN